MSGRKPFRFAAVMALMALTVVAAGFLGTDNNNAGTDSDFEWSAPVVTVLAP